MSTLLYVFFACTAAAHVVPIQAVEADLEDTWDVREYPEEPLSLEETDLGSLEEVFKPKKPKKNKKAVSPTSKPSRRRGLRRRRSRPSTNPLTARVVRLERAFKNVTT